MNSYTNRTAENVLFSVLIVAVLGWTAASVASEKLAPPAAESCMVAHAHDSVAPRG